MASGSEADLPPAASSEIQEKFQAFLGGGQRAGAARRADETGDGHCAVGVGPMRPLREAPRRARRGEEGFTPEEIDEAAWMAIAFGGSPTMMFYNETKRG